VTGLGIVGETLNFVLDNTIVGTGVTNSSGVANAHGVTTSDPVGTDPGGVIVTFSGDTNYLAAANATGDLVVSPAATTVTASPVPRRSAGQRPWSATVTSTSPARSFPTRPSASPWTERR